MVASVVEPVLETGPGNAPVRDRLSILATIVLLLAASTSSAEEDVTVELGWRTGSACPTAWKALPLSDRPPEGVEPIAELPGARYGRVDLADDWSLLYALETAGGITGWNPLKRTTRKLRSTASF